ncbi:MAG: helix-turn-helix domain-containing protein [Ruminiclostridium sp.]|nr:helix-turn-helix domain-containing protein [Ruminiclostridium sp.]
MEAAKELLKNRDLKIHEISEMVGFKNPNYFSLKFKKYTGMLPQKIQTLVSIE